MAINDNGFNTTTIDYSSSRPHISEGAVVGITFAWIVGIIGLYILGICLIKIYYKRRVDDDSDENVEKGREVHRKKYEEDGR